MANVVRNFTTAMRSLAGNCHTCKFYKSQILRSAFGVLFCRFATEALPATSESPQAGRSLYDASGVVKGYVAEAV